MQSVVGCIISQTINGHLFIESYGFSIFLFQRSRQLSNQEEHEDANQKYQLNSQSLREYQVTLSSGEQMYILAANSMDAAYSALELSEDRDVNLLNVSLLDEW